jgi:hypothetical protein
MPALLSIIKLLIQLYPMIHAGIIVAEAKFGAGKGTEKLNHVLDAVKDVLPADAVEHATTIDELLPTVVNAAVQLMTQKGELPPHTAPAFGSADTSASG